MWKYLTAIILFSSLSSHATTQTRCQLQWQPYYYRYCVARTLGSQNKDVLYYFHGMGAGAQAWQYLSNPQQLRKYWDTHGIDAPSVVSISFGPIWGAAEANSSPLSGYLDILIYELIPHIEDIEFGNDIGKRLMMGESMGGFNATQLLFKAAHLFNKVALISPAFPSIDPFLPESEIEDYVEQRGLRKNLIKLTVFYLKHLYPTPQDWKNANPFQLAESNLGPFSPALYISNGLDDKTGIRDGIDNFVKIGRLKQAPVSYQQVSGGHCATDIPTLARFLTRP